ncbi:heparin/heparin-sulfate lyase HepB [Paenibacillus qinlingensis]|uniref:heparin/heparin-sulfate lyase HepB n=1 Tax=Paenibacillus qinlingensis TaxID=1837343 RepID=UPI0015674372|nr:heparin/heparin-sulfate lyase HepB [Paenibacillus qinlingensis]NQX58652.1 discoidin domain-containing protein [Paenibacillus qinlingensis]
MLKKRFQRVFSSVLVCLILFTSIITWPPQVQAVAATFNPDVIIEAEDGVITGNMGIYNDDATAAGSYITSKNNPSPAAAPANTDSPDALISINLPSAASYAIWARVYSTDGGNDSYYFAYDQSAYALKSMTVVKPEWQWIKMDTLQFTQGAHALKIKYRENNFKIDRFVVTGNLLYTPTGMGVNVADSIIQENIYPNPFPTPTITPPANEHPRLFVRSSDIPTIKANLTKGELVKVWSRVNTTAAMNVTGLLNPPASGQSNYDDSQRKVIEANALLYLLDGNQAAGQKAISIMNNYINTAMIPIVGDSTRAMGQVIITAAMVYDWCYPIMTNEQRLNFRLNMDRIARNMEIGYPPLGQGAVVGHGSEAQLMRDMIGFGVAAYDENPNIYNIAAGRFFKEFVPARDFLYQSNSYSQGDSYGPYRFQWDMFASYIFKRMGAGNVFSAEQQYVPYQSLYTRRPDGQLLRNGDSYTQNYTSVGTYWSVSPSLFYAASYYNDPYLRSEFKKEYDYNNNIVEDTWMVLFDNPDQQSESVASLPPSKYFGEPMGQMVARTGWGTGFNSNTVVASMNISNYNFVNHQHLEAGSFQLYYKGALAIDSGVYQGTGGKFAGNHDGNYNKRTIAHNAMLVYDPSEEFLLYGSKKTSDNTDVINDGGQRFPNSYNEPSTIEELKDPSKGYEVGKVLHQAIGTDAVKPDFTYIKGDITKAYTSKVSDYKRSMVFLNMKDSTYPGALIVYDKLTASDPTFKKTWLLHSVNEPEISGNTQTIRNGNGNYNGKMVNTTLLPVQGNTDITKVGGANFRYSFNGINYPEPIASGNSDESGSWRIELSPKTPAATNEFLNVMQVMDNDEVKAPLLTEPVTSDKIIGAKISDRVVTFGKESQQLSGSFQFQVTGNESNLYYLVTDLAPGYWKVEKDGVTATTQYEVTQENGTIYYKGAPGTYTLTHSAQLTLPLAAAVSDDDAIVVEKIGLNIDGVKTAITPAPKRINGIPMLPLKNVMEKLGARVNEDVAARTATIIKLGKAITLNADSKEITKNGVSHQLTQNVVILDDAFYVPTDLIKQSGWGTADWDEYYVSFNIKSIRPVDNNGLIAVTVSDGGQYNGENTIDLDASSIWSAPGDNATITYDLGSLKPISKIGIAWYKGNERRAIYEVQTSSDGQNWVTQFDGMSSGTTSQMESTVFDNTITRYIRIVGHGFLSPYGTIHNTAISEVTLYSAISPIVGVKAKSTDITDSETTKAYDGNFNTYWTQQGVDQWIQFDLGVTKTVSGFGGAWWRGDIRQEIFQIKISEDEENWTTVFDGKSSGTTLNIEDVYFAPVQGRYVRIVCNGNTASTTVPNNGFNSLAEAVIYASDARTVVAEHSVSVGAITFKDELNHEISAIPANSSFTVHAAVAGNVDSAKVKLMYALYKNNEILAIGQVEDTLQKDQVKDVSLEIITPADIQDHAVRIFVWDELNRPLTSAVVFPKVISHDATLSGLKINNQDLAGFASHTNAYTFTQGNTTPPVLSATTTHNLATTVITQATSVPGTATVVVTAEDGHTQETYSVSISKLMGTAATLSDMKINNVTVAGFNKDTLSYSVTLPSKAIPTLTVTKTDINANAVVTLPTVLPGTATVDVTSEDGLQTKSYSILLDYVRSTDASLKDLKVDGTMVSGFAPATTVYSYTYGSTGTPVSNPFPVFTATATDPNAQVVINSGGFGIIKVTAEDGITIRTYKVNVIHNLKPTDDNFVNKTNATTVADATLQQIGAKYGSDTQYVLQQFDLTGITGTVSSAILNQRIKVSQGTSTPGVTSVVYAFDSSDTSSWAETTVNYAAVSTAITSAIASPSIGQYVVAANTDWTVLSLDVTSFINQFIAAGKTKVTFVFTGTVQGLDPLIATKEKGAGYVRLYVNIVP